jgi:hypothetical protein
VVPGHPVRLADKRTDSATKERDKKMGSAVRCLSVSHLVTVVRHRRRWGGSNETDGSSRRRRVVDNSRNLDRWVKSFEDANRPFYEYPQ